MNHDGDSDSTGSITGNLLGTLFASAGIPEPWLEPLELRDVISQVADDLHQVVTLDSIDIDSAPGGEFISRYPGG